MVLDKKKFLKNSIYVYIGEVASKALLFLFNAITARQLGVIDFGIFTFAYSIGLIIVGIVDFGTNNLILKKFSETKKLNENLLHKVLLLQLLLSISCLFAISVFLGLYNNDPKSRAVIIIILISLLFENITSIYRNILKATEKFDLDMLTNILSSMLRVILGLSFYSFISNILSLSMGITISTIISLVLSVVFYRRIRSKTHIEKGIMAFDSYSMIDIIKQCYVYAIPSIIKSLYLRIDSILVKIYISQVELGLYNSSLKILFTLHFIPVSLIQVIFPTINKLFYEKRQSDIDTSFPKIYLLFFIGINSLQMFFVIFSNFFIRIVYGHHYIQSENIFRIVMTSLVFTSLTALLNYVFIANNNVSHTNRYFSYSIIIKLFLTIVFSSYYSALGAAYSFLLSEIFQFLLFLFGSFNYNLNKSKLYFITFIEVVLIDLIILYASISLVLKLLILLSLSFIVFFTNNLNIIKVIKSIRYTR